MPDDPEKNSAPNRDGLLAENRRLAQRCLELESAARKQLDQLRAANAVLTRGPADLHALLENSAIGFALLDLNLKIIGANSALADMLGIARDDLTGVNFGKFIYVGKLPAFSRLTNRYVGRGRADDIIEVVTRDGGLLPCRMAVSDWLDPEGAFQGHFLLVFDAGAELVAVGRLREMEESMAEAEKSRALFLDVITRELRGPSNAIMGMSRMLMEAGLNRRQAELAGVIHTSASSLIRLVEDFADLLRVDAGDGRVNAVPVSPASLAAGVVNLFGVRGEEKGIPIRVNIGKTVPDLILADSVLLLRVLAHLLDNALKFTSRGHVTVSIELVGERVRFMVSDTGPGIAPEIEANLLGVDSERFRPGVRRLGGGGVGLAICRRLVTLMGGRLAYESAPGAGSEFHFTIPLNLPDGDAAAKAIEPPPDAILLPPMKILLADANPLSISMLQACLNFDGHELTLVDNGVDAAERCMDNAYDLVIIDIGLPKLDGPQTLRLIRENERTHNARRVPIILMVPAGPSGETGRFLADADAVVKKPVLPVKLMAAAAEATGMTPLAIARCEREPTYQARDEGSAILRLDGNQMVNLRQMMPEGQFLSLLRFFLEDAVPGLFNLEKMLLRPEPDRERIALAAAKSGGLAAMLGFSALSELLGRIENIAGSTEEKEPFSALARELCSATDDSLEELKRILPEAFATLSAMRIGDGG